MNRNPLEGRCINPWFDPHKAKTEQHEQTAQADEDVHVIAARAKRKRRLATAPHRGSSPDHD